VRDPHPPAETWRKVGIKDGDRLALLHAPATWGTEGSGVAVRVVRRRTPTPADVVVAFYRARRELEREAAVLAAAIEVDGMVWSAWPRKAAGHVSDLGDEVVRAALLAVGLVDVKVAALDEDWSGLKFVWRRERRDAERRRREGSTPAD
jgi:hypothetical protein